MAWPCKLSVRVRATRLPWRRENVLAGTFMAVFAVMWIVMMRRIMGGLVFDACAVAIAFTFFLAIKLRSWDETSQLGLTMRELLLIILLCACGFYVATAAYFDRATIIQTKLHFSFRDAHTNRQLQNVALRAVGNENRIIAWTHSAPVELQVAIEIGQRIIGSAPVRAANIDSIEIRAAGYESETFELNPLLRGLSERTQSGNVTIPSLHAERTIDIPLVRRTSAQ